MSHFKGNGARFFKKMQECVGYRGRGTGRQSKGLEINHRREKYMSLRFQHTLSNGLFCQVLFLVCVYSSDQKGQIALSGRSLLGAYYEG